MKKSIIAIVTVLVLSLCCYLSAFAAGGYDSTVDPVVTLSYINDILLPQVMAQITEIRSLVGTGGGTGVPTAEFNALKTKVTELETAVAKLNGTASTAPGTVVADVFTAISMSRGQTLYAPASAVELILRSGSAKVVSPFTTEGLKQGLSDLTSAGDVQNGEALIANHLMLIPRGGDGRGIVITSDIAYIVVRGEYQIVN